MDDEPVPSRSPDKAARWAISLIALILIGIEISQIQYYYGIVETYATSDQTKIFEAVDRMAVAHYIRIAVVATLILSWRWSLWLTASSFAVVYIPNPWVSADFMNSVSFALFLFTLVLTAHFFDRRLLFPWRREFRNDQVSQPQGLISILLDQSREFGDRHDAAMDLAKFDEPEARAALTTVKNTPDEDPDLVEEAEQSLLEIQRRTAQV